MSRSEKIEQIITKMEDVKDIWGKLGEDKIAQEIMGEIGVGCYTSEAVYRGIINKLKGYKEEEEKEMSETTLIQKALDDYNNTVTPEFFLQFDNTKEDFIDDEGRYPKYAAINSYSDLQFTFDNIEELKERLNAEMQDYNMSLV